jgi:regulator of RNase E activity RraA
MSDVLFDILRKVTTATIATMLLKKGIRRCWMNGPKPLSASGGRIVGRAFTLRFVPVREDVANDRKLGQRDLDARRDRGMPAGSIAVADAMGVPAAGIFGDILCARMKKRSLRRS